MTSYVCIVNMPGVVAREVVALRVADDDQPIEALARVMEAWPGFETLVPYDGERLVAVRANPGLGFADTPLDVHDGAA